jgi:hypothetical protein
LGLRSPGLVDRAGYRHRAARAGVAREAPALAEARDLPVELWQIEATLGTQYQAGGNTQRAQQAFELARQVAQRLAENITDHGLRANFLSTASA